MDANLAIGNFRRRFLAILFFHYYVKKKAAESARVKYWEIIADNLSKAGWCWGCVSAIDSNPGERSSLRTRIAATESVWLCTRMKS
jgi:hypothetical protein